VTEKSRKEETVFSTLYIYVYGEALLQKSLTSNYFISR